MPDHFPDEEYVYKDTRSCHMIQYNLKDLVITQCVLYSTDFVLNVMALLIIFYFVRKNMILLNMCLSRVSLHKVVEYLTV